jgi:hypothetical protein
MGPTIETVVRSLTNITPTDGNIEKIEALREAAKDYAYMIFECVPEGPERTLATRDLETSVMWAVKQIVLSQDNAE